jgi:hypothetical protein
MSNNPHFKILLAEIEAKFDKGEKEYNSNLYKDYTVIQLLQHLKEEMIDAVIYIDAIILKTNK